MENSPEILNATKYAKHSSLAYLRRATTLDRRYANVRAIHTSYRLLNPPDGINSTSMTLPTENEREREREGVMVMDRGKNNNEKINELFCCVTVNTGSGREACSF